MTTVIILTGILIPCAFAFGWAVGHDVGKTDGYAEAAEDCRRRCHAPFDEIQFDRDTNLAYRNCRAIAEEGAGDDK